MTKSRKATFFSPYRVRSTVSCGPKGKLVIQKTNRVSKRIRLANLALCKLNKYSPTNTTPSPTATNVSSVSTNGTQSTSGMSSLTQESTRYKKHGVTFNEFIEGNGLDWRKFGCTSK